MTPQNRQAEQRDICIEKCFTNLEAVLKVLVPNTDLVLLCPLRSQIIIYSAVFRCGTRNSRKIASIVQTCLSGAAGSWRAVCIEIVLIFSLVASVFSMHSPAEMQTG